MVSRAEHSMRMVPRGVGDTVLGDNAAAGLMASLTNLIHDTMTPGSFICRPANTLLINFASLPGSPGTAGVVTDLYQVGDIVYGLVAITAGIYAGYDIPFAYNIGTAAFLAITGITTSNVPVSQATSGAWTPPQMALTGVDLVVTHIGFPGGAGAYFGYFNITNPAAITWTAGNTTGNALPSVPQACGSFNNRTRFACGNAIYYTDTLTLNMTNANQSQTYGDNTPVTTLAPLPTSSTALNITQGLLAFKLTRVALITGDAVGTGANGIAPLALNELSSTVGTAAPRSVVSTPQGVRFMANDGIREINFYGFLSEPDADLAFPFISALTPSRVCAAFNADIYRICLQNGSKVTTPFEDYWYEYKRKGWSGPHSFRYDSIFNVNNDWVVASNSIVGKVWLSFSVQDVINTGVTFIENGSQLTFTYQTPPMTDLDNVYANAVHNTTLEIAAPSGGQTYNFTMQNESGTQLAAASIAEPTNQAIWGAFNWGAKNWGASTSGLAPVTIPWDQTCVSNRFVFQMLGNSSLGFKVSGLRNGYKHLNYLLN